MQVIVFVCSYSKIMLLARFFYALCYVKWVFLVQFCVLLPYGVSKFVGFCRFPKELSRGDFLSVLIVIYVVKQYGISP